MPSADPGTAATDRSTAATDFPDTETADTPALTLTVYRTGPDGRRRDIREQTFHRGTDGYAPRYPSWPDCTCPQHRTT